MAFSLPSNTACRSLEPFYHTLPLASDTQPGTVYSQRLRLFDYGLCSLGLRTQFWNPIALIDSNFDEALHLAALPGEN
jgi:hypothetical protein